VRSGDPGGRSNDRFLRPRVQYVVAARGGTMSVGLVTVLFLAGSGRAQEPAPIDTSHPSATSELPVSLDKIKEGLAHQPVIVLDQQPMFRSGTSERRPRYFDLSEQFALPKEPPVWNPGWHNEFLSMVTPPEFRQWQAFAGIDLLQLSATSLAEAGVAALVGKGLRAIADTRDAAREDAARREVDQALAAFFAAKAAAGTQ
jgi:hypothetical protein